jgi:hypothetical protein
LFNFSALSLEFISSISVSFSIFFSFFRFLQLLIQKKLRYEYREILPVPLSVAETLMIPLALSKLLQFVVTPLSAGGKPSKWKRPVLLSAAIALAPAIREFQLLVENLQQ